MRTIARIASAALLASAFGLFPPIALAQTDQLTPTPPPSGLSTNTPNPFATTSASPMESPGAVLGPNATPTVNPLASVSPAPAMTTTTTTVTETRPSGLWGLLGLIGLLGIFGLGGRRKRSD
jgi:hypothetical protein